MKSMIRKWDTSPNLSYDTGTPEDAFMRTITCMERWNMEDDMIPE